MHLQPLTVSDITPATLGFYNLVTSCGTEDCKYEIKTYPCGTNTAGTVLVRGNYSNIPLSISAGGCIQLSNPHPTKAVDIYTSWDTNTPGNIFLGLIIPLYVIGIIISYLAAIYGGVLTKRVYRKYKVWKEKRNKEKEKDIVEQAHEIELKIVDSPPPQLLSVTTNPPQVPQYEDHNRGMQITMGPYPSFN